MSIKKEYNKLILLEIDNSMFFIIEEAKEKVLDLSKGTGKVL